MNTCDNGVPKESTLRQSVLNFSVSFVSFHPRSLVLAGHDQVDRVQIACELEVKNGMLERVIRDGEVWYRKKPDSPTVIDVSKCAAAYDKLLVLKSPKV